MIPHQGRWLRALALIIVVAFASLIAGCAMTVPERPIAYVPQENVKRLKDADTVPVEIRVEDLQPSESINRLEFFLKDRDEMRFRVKDAADTLKTAAETELKARGFNVATGGALVTIQLIHFEANYQSEDLGFVTAVRGSLFMRVEVRSQAGKVFFSKEMEDQATPVSGLIMLHPATQELHESLEEAFKGLFADPAFTAAIFAARPKPPTLPTPAGPARIA